MSPQEFHDACHEACCECPQFRPIDDDCYIDWGRTTFGDIPKKGMYAVYQYWKHDQTLWRSGYHECLPESARLIFKNIEKVIAKAVKDYCDSL